MRGRQIPSSSSKSNVANIVNSVEPLVVTRQLLTSRRGAQVQVTLRPRVECEIQIVLDQT